MKSLLTVGFIRCLPQEQKPPLKSVRLVAGTETNWLCVPHPARRRIPPQHYLPFSLFCGIDRITVGRVPVLHAGALRGGAHRRGDDQPHHEANVRGRFLLKQRDK